MLNKQGSGVNSPKPMSRRAERAARALRAARDRGPLSTAKSAAHEGVSENPIKRDLRNNLLQRRRKNLKKRGTSVARVKRYENEEEEEEVQEQVVDEKAELDKQAIESSMGIASPLPRSILRPTKGIIKKR